MNNSTYAYNAFLVSMAAFAGGSVLLLIIALILVCCGRRSSAHRSTLLPRVISGLLMASASFAALMFGSISGFDAAPPAVTLLLACIVWLLATCASVYVMFGQWRQTAVEMQVTSHGGESTTFMLLPAAKRVINVCLLNAKVFNVTCVIGYITCYAVIFVMYGMCYCTNPFQITTWASRRDQPKYCFDDQFCHQYAMLGYNSSQMRLVGHVVSRGGTPTATYASLCLVDLATLLPSCSSVHRAINGTIVPHLDFIDEDPRYLSHIVLTGLNASTAYYAMVTIVLGNGALINSSISFRTVPSNRSEFTFVSGGDLYSTNQGQYLLFVAFAARHDPSFVLFGGDLSYSNNMRTCYLRFDYFNALIASLRTGDGLSVPLLIIPGNHESGGYLSEGNDWSKYYFFLPYFPQYDDEVPATLYTTHHTHDVAQLTVLGLDSNLMESCDSQKQYVATQCARAASKGNTLVAAYHNGMYPSIRDFYDSHAIPVRNAFFDIFQQYNLTLALEFHDHAYKRTFVVDRTGSYLSTNVDGIVFIGDGGLGTSRDSTSSGQHNYLAKFVSTTNVQVATVFVNGSILVRSFDDTQSVIDSVVIQSRTVNRGG